MTQFHEGQEVEVRMRAGPRDDLGEFKIVWRDAKIVRLVLSYIGCTKREDFERFEVELPDRNRAVFDGWNIRAVSSDPHEYDRLDDTGHYHMTRRKVKW